MDPNVHKERIESPAPKEDLIRMLPITSARADVDEEGILVGYASPFNEWADIDSWWEGRFREMFLPSAFDKTLKERAERIKVLFNHGFDPSIGDKPLGKPRLMKPDATGLWTETPLDDTSYNRDLKESLRSGAIDGMSIRFSVVKEEWNYDTEDEIPERTISEARLYEFGPVTWPAYEATTAGIRSLADFREWRNKQSRTEAVSTSGEAASTPDANDGAASTSQEAASTSAGERERVLRLSEVQITDERRRWKSSSAT